MEPFKNLINPALVQAAARHLSRTLAGFDARRFTALATDGLDALELKARAMRVADALEATLPDDFGKAADAIEAALAPAAEHEQLSELRLSDAGLAGWVLWPMGEFIARRGIHHPERALAALAQLTQRFSAEFAIRPFIVAHPDLSFATLARWASHPNLHVRRLVSEGSRPRLPWGLQLKALVADPTPTLPLLRALQDDASQYVRRSVANHLNDIAKDHPGLVAQWLEEHLPGAPAPRRALLKHASRTLIKKCDARVLEAWGLGAPFRGNAALEVRPARVKLGGEVQLKLVLKSKAASAQRLVIDYAVHHVKADGGSSPKVFKGWNVELPARAELTLGKRHSLRPITTRKYHAGLHELDVMVNGKVVAQSAFDLVLRSSASVPK
jgi:3-methyladenine DNA glycosylase AlkC